MLNFAVDGGWTDWADAIPCSATCGNGTKDQVRHCSNPAPQGNGMTCAGTPEQTVLCNIGQCVAPSKNFHGIEYLSSFM